MGALAVPHPFQAQEEVETEDRSPSLSLCLRGEVALLRWLFPCGVKNSLEDLEADMDWPLGSVWGKHGRMADGSCLV